MSMADPRKCLANQPLELQHILEEARHRWLRPGEILEILGNYQKFTLSPEPPIQPSAGSLFLFDRKALRYFRKDGHSWRKKKDGKTVREAHEKLKAGSVEVLHCYYAHGEDNDSFQRRCYWMLDEKFEHIVLVHYREVKEGYKSGVSHLLADSSIQVDRPQPSSAPSFGQTPSHAFIAQAFCESIPNRIDWNGQALSSDFDDVDSKDDLGASSLIEPVSNSMSHNASLLGAEVEEFPVLPRNSPGTWFIGSNFVQTSGSSMLPGSSSFSKSAYHMHDQKNYVGQHDGTDFISHKLTDSRLDGDVPDTVATEDRLITDIAATVHQRSIQIDIKPKDVEANNSAVRELKKLDSFGRWMDKEIGGDYNDSLMASDSANYWNTLAENDDKEVSSLSHHMQLDVESLGPSLAHEQLFTIHDFSPDWAFSGVETKVLIIGTFLGSKTLSSESKWGCMFGEIEVFAEVLIDNVIRCQAPLHATGRVPFYVTCRNRLACSEVREFEFRENPSRTPRIVQGEELQFEVRLAKLFRLCPESTSLNCSIEGCGKCKIISTLNSVRNDRKKDLTSVKQSSMVSGANCMNARDNLIQSLLKDRFFEWLVFKVHGGGKGPDVLDNEGQGVIHLAAALGYEWSMALIVTATNNPNFRDALGRTALHWASYFGREETVITLVRLGVDPTAVDDPTSAFPGGRIAADLASSQGHKGIAGYLAEAFLTRNLSTLNIKGHSTDSVPEDEATASTANIMFPSNGGDDQVSLRESLAAVRKSTLAAALIQAAYRSYSFHYGRLPESPDDSEILASLCPKNKNHRRSHFEDYLHSAAVKIQQKYRGWKGRKDYMKMRMKVLKIQAHVRGNRVRKQYKKVIWSVSIVEKAILRWRRKGSGLRGFRVEKTIGNAKPETDNTDEYEFLRISRKQKFDGVEKALERVKSMVHDPAARDQYMRLVAQAENLKMTDEAIRESREDECFQ
ncbi:calmodulin-binding transcription activator 3-like isoform X2 [Euphorbia lathyris]|uniref:calmodulin-binding transcription activator 3-like isoform X2 n=1 Tax=Euphorbia lathyris TaxID=212925 RepID=UPI0033144172